MIIGNALRPVKKTLTPGSSRFSFGLRALAFRNAGSFAAPAAEIIELRPAHAALTDHLDGIHQRAEDGEHAFHAFAVGDLAHREALVEPCARARNAHTLEC